jgi:hypothetical protein
MASLKYKVLPSLSGYFAKLSFLMEKKDADRQKDEAKWLNVHSLHPPNDTQHCNCEKYIMNFLSRNNKPAVRNTFRSNQTSEINTLTQIVYINYYILTTRNLFFVG